METTEFPHSDQTYLPYLWVLCAAVSALCAIATATVLLRTDRDLGAMLGPAVGTVLFAVSAFITAPMRDV